MNSTAVLVKKAPNWAMSPVIREISLPEWFLLWNLREKDITLAKRALRMSITMRCPAARIMTDVKYLRICSMMTTVRNMDMSQSSLTLAGDSPSSRELKTDVIQALNFTTTSAPSGTTPSSITLSGDTMVGRPS